MALDRDDADEIRRVTAMRFTAALLSAGRHTATDAVTAGLFAADELLSRLRPVAPLPGAPLAAPSRPEWVPKVGDRVRVLRDNANSAVVKRGDEFVVTRLEGDHYFRPRDVMAYGVKDDYGDEQYVRVENLEPCAAPSAAKGSDTGTAAAMPGVSPAATPAAWVPSVGDVVKHVSESDKVATTREIRVVVSTNPIRWVYVENGVRKGESGPTGWGNDVRFVRRATSSERAAAGLPVDVEESRSGDDRPASGQGGVA